MNKIFRNIKENRNLDALEESDDDEEFENINEDKFVKLDKSITMECIFNKRWNTYVPLKIVERGIVVSILSLETTISRQQIQQPNNPRTNTNTNTNHHRGDQYQQSYNNQGRHSRGQPPYNQNNQNNRNNQNNQPGKPGQYRQYNPNRQNNHYRQSFNQT